MRAWLPGLAVYCLLASAQSASVPYPLKKLTVEGNKRFTAAQIITAAGVKTGQIVSRETFDEARDRLMATGAFENVGYTIHPDAAKTGYEAAFDVAEVALMYRYRFEDLPAPDETLRAMLREQEPFLGDVIPLTEDVGKRYDRALTRFFDGKIEVASHLSYDLPGEPTILFRPAAARPHISQIHFTGYAVVPAKTLFTKFAEAAVGAEYSEAGVRRLLDANVVPLYEAKGCLRVAFPKITAEPTKEPEVVGVAVTITIEEGPVYKLGEVRFAGDAAPAAKELERIVPWRKDETADFDQVAAGLKAITKRFQGKGYLHAAARANRTVKDQDHTVDLIVTVDQGPLFTYGKLDVRGLDLIGEPAIRKMWGAKDGKPYDPEYPDAFLKDVRAQAVFDNLGPTSAETKVNEDAKTVDVTLVFAPKPVDAGRKRTRGPGQFFLTKNF